MKPQISVFLKWFVVILKRHEREYNSRPAMKNILIGADISVEEL
jgi:hypothetical protein